MRYDRTSADCHLDLIWLPPDLFVSEAPKEMKDQADAVGEVVTRSRRARRLSCGLLPAGSTPVAF